MTTAILHDTLIILSTPTCQRCKFVARHLDDRGVEFEYVDLSDPANSHWVAEMQERNLTQVPQTIRGETWIEGVQLDAIDAMC
jgi:glutaredoxin